MKINGNLISWVAELGADYDLCVCLEYNPQPFNLIDVERVLAVIEGENDEKDWHWVVKLRDNRYVYLRGGCDYTGWDCQSWADTIFLDPESLNVSLSQAVEQSNLVREEGELINEFVVDLLYQLREGKKTTWREKNDKEFDSYDWIFDLKIFPVAGGSIP